MIKISKRLQMIAGLVTEGKRLADVGTDHAYIPIWMKQNGKIASAIAMDVNQGPLDSAKEHIHACLLDTYIETRLSDGLDALGKEDADSVVIAGMGGALTVRILQRGLDKYGVRTDGSVDWSVRELILQPQSEIEEVRRFLHEHHFLIVDEDMLIEDGKYYTAMRAVPKKQIDILENSDAVIDSLKNHRKGYIDDSNSQDGRGNDCSVKIMGQEWNADTDTEEKISREKQQQMEDMFGPILLKRKHPVLKQWLLREIEIQQKILKNLEKAGNAGRSLERQQEVEAKLWLLKHAIWSETA